VKLDDVLKEVDPEKAERMAAHPSHSIQKLDDLTTKMIGEQVGIAVAIKQLFEGFQQMKGNNHLTELATLALMELLEEKGLVSKEEIANRMKEITDDANELDTQPQQVDQPSTEVPLSQDET